MTDMHFVSQGLSDLCRASGGRERDMRIWRIGDRGEDESERMTMSRSCGKTRVHGDGAGMDGVDEANDEDAEEWEAANAVLTAVFLSPDSVDALAAKIPFARETSDLQLRLVVSTSVTSIGTRVC
jgi:hypothetical protein